MANRDGFLEFVLDQLAGIDEVVPRRMFGGVGIYAGGVFFAIIDADVLYLKVDDTTRADYERAGMQPFKPYEDQSITMQYYEVPTGVLENAEDLTDWARRAITVAERAAHSTKNTKKTRNTKSTQTTGTTKGTKTTKNTKKKKQKRASTA